MTLRKECDVRNPLSSLQGTVGTKRTLAMQCANPQCSKELLYLREGRIELLELESHAGDPFQPDDGAFAMNCLPSKYFWLCGECAELYILKRWTTSGLVLLLRNRDASARPVLAGCSSISKVV